MNTIDIRKTTVHLPSFCLRPFKEEGRLHNQNYFVGLLLMERLHPSVGGCDILAFARSHSIPAGRQPGHY